MPNHRNTLTPNFKNILVTLAHLCWEHHAYDHTTWNYSVAAWDEKTGPKSVVVLEYAICVIPLGKFQSKVLVISWQLEREREKKWIKDIKEIERTVTAWWERCPTSAINCVNCFLNNNRWSTNLHHSKNNHVSIITSLLLLLFEYSFIDSMHLIYDSLLNIIFIIMFVINIFTNQLPCFKPPCI